MDSRWVLTVLLLMVAACALDVQMMVNGTDPTVTRIPLVSGDALRIAFSVSNPASTNVSITGYRLSTNPPGLLALIERASGQPLDVEFPLPLVLSSGDRLSIEHSFTVPELPLPSGDYDLKVMLYTDQGTLDWTFLLSVPSKGIIDSIIGVLSSFILRVLGLFLGG